MHRVETERPLQQFLDRTRRALLTEGVFGDCGEGRTRIENIIDEKRTRKDRR
jgi:hypothetical protein